MRPRLIVLRPEPGNRATCDRIVAAGGVAVAMPLFATGPLAWHAPNAGDFDALLLTSANAVRHAGPALAEFHHLPVVAVGAATARAATAAGLSVAATGDGDAGAAALLLERMGAGRMLHLCGREHRSLAGVCSIPVYASDPIDPPMPGVLAGATALIHSPRAGARLAALVDAAGIDRARVAVAAISRAALTAAGDGWRCATAIDRPDDNALIRAALSIDPDDGGRDKTA
ncbi:uroporphyrinogen-III synthase [Sphingomonas sp. IW22]|uniref:uroporphyrinogen-III synthase n=1 Tax=Sphingomonas sp. IW22 TaxID=3242489 RepID=UPI003520BD60